jgi:hypothetical protein
MNKVEFKTRNNMFGDEVHYFKDNKFNAEIIQIELDDDDDCYNLIIEFDGELIIDENGTFEEMEEMAQEELDKYKESEK